MKFHKNKFVSLSALFFVAAMVFMVPAVAEASSVNCGDTITTSTTLTSNLNCTGNGLIIGASGITLDCNGFTLQGSVFYNGIQVSGEQNVQIKNCNIKNFYNGISLSSSSFNILSNNTTSSNTYSGISLSSSLSNILSGNIVYSNSYTGIYLSHSNSNALSNSTLYSNAGPSIFLESSLNNTISKNTAYSNAYGIFLSLSSSSNTLSNNTVYSNSYGIFLQFSSSNTLTGNAANSNTYGIYLDTSSSNSLTNNNIINNNTQAFDNGINSWDFNNSGNYWSDYDTPQEGCYDNNANGICDSPKLIPGGSNKDHFPFTNQIGWQKLNEYSVDPFTDALYHLDEGSGGTAVDATGKHNGVLQTGGTSFPKWTANTAPLKGSTYAMEFDGNKGYVDVSNGLLDKPSAFTIETWFNIQGMPKASSTCGGVDCFMLLSKNTDDDLTSLFQLFYESTNVIGINVYSGSNLYRVDYALPGQVLNQWHHVAATYDGSVLKLFVDGIQVDSVNIPTALNGVTSSFFIGKDGRNNFPDRVFNGYLDEVRISNYARNPCQFNVNFGSCPATVLLIHGIYSDDTVWPQVESSLQTAGFQVFKVGQVLGKKGLVPNNGDITVLAGQVKQAIQNIKATGVPKVNIVAHSMGGLATRSYISTGNYQNDIDKLITLGTPNEGAPAAKSYLAWFYGTTQGDISADTARYQMIPNSGFLNALNSNFNTKGVQHTEIAGTDTNYTALNLMILAIQSLPSPWNSIFMQGFPFSYYWQTTDTVVPQYSVNIPNISCYEHLNVHATPLEAFGNSNAYYTDNFVISEIIKTLQGISTSMNPCPPGTLKLSSGQTTNSTQLLTLTGTVNPGQTQTVLSNASLGTKFNTFLSWTNGQLNLQFISPTGVIVDSTNYQNYPGASYTAGTGAQGPFETFTFTQPEQGNWTVNVIGTNIPAPENYTLNLAMEKNIQLTIATDKTNYIPNDTFLITGTLTDTTSGTPVLNATVLGTITDPANATSSLTLFDDGSHNDGLANDGTYGNSYTNTSQEGVYLITVDGSITGQFQIQDTHAVFVDLQPDLSIQPQNISFNPTILSKSEDNNVTVTATIFNIGDQDANNVEIDFYDGDPMKGGNVFATTSVSVLAGGSAQTQANLFIPKQQFGSGGAGKTTGTALKNHDIHIIISSYSGFIEKDYTNNQASKLLKYGR